MARVDSNLKDWSLSDTPLQGTEPIFVPERDGNGQLVLENGALKVKRSGGQAVSRRDRDEGVAELGIREGAVFAAEDHAGNKTTVPAFPVDERIFILGGGEEHRLGALRLARALAAAAILGGDNFPLCEEEVGNLDGLTQKPAGIVAQVNHEPLRARRFDFLHGGTKFLRGLFVEPGVVDAEGVDADERDPVRFIDEPVPAVRIIRASRHAHDRVPGDPRPHQRHWELRGIVSLAMDGKCHLRTGLAGDLVPRLFAVHPGGRLILDLVTSPAIYARRRRQPASGTRRYWSWDRNRRG